RPLADGAKQFRENRPILNPFRQSRQFLLPRGVKPLKEKRHRQETIRRRMLAVSKDALEMRSSLNGGLFAERREDGGDAIGITIFLQPFAEYRRFRRHLLTQHPA